MHTKCSLPSQLATLRLARFRLRLKPRETLLLPAYKGSALRGGFGQVFRRLLASEPTVALASVCSASVVPITTSLRLRPRPAASYKDARRYREMADYSDLVEFVREDAEGQLQDAEAFIQEVAKLLDEKSQ